MFLDTSIVADALDKGTNDFLISLKPLIGLVLLLVICAIVSWGIVKLFARK